MTTNHTLDGRLHLAAANVAVGRDYVHRALWSIVDPPLAKRIEALKKATRHLQAAHRALDDLICEVDGIRLDLIREEQAVHLSSEYYEAPD